MRVAKEFFLTLNETTSQTQEKHFAVTVLVIKIQCNALMSPSINLEDSNGSLKNIKNSPFLLKRKSRVAL